MSQDEDRRVKMYTRRKRMIELANLRPDEYDAHTANAARIFGVSESEVTKEQRYLGKRAVHAAQRGMRGNKLSEVLLKDGYVVPAKKCQEMIDAYLEANWEIRDCYFPFVRETFLRQECLVNTWGRTIRFDNELSMGRLNDEVWRKLYSFLPQSECSDNLNQNGFIPLWEYIRKRKLRSRINLQVHDELVISCPLDEAWEVTNFTVKSLEQPRWYFGNKLVVPAEVTIGMNWLDGYEFKRLPSRKEFEEVMHAEYEKGR